MSATKSVTTELPIWQPKVMDDHRETWDLLRRGSTEQALALLRESYERDASRFHIMGLGVAYLWSGDYRASWVHSAQVASQRFNAVALAGFAGIAMLLAAVGLYGVVAYAVGKRTHEIGVRIALGAKPQSVLFMVVTQTLELTLIGDGLGVAASFGLMRFMRSMPFGVKPSDPATFVLVTGALIGVAIAACWIPAQRAADVDPMVAVRYE